MESPQFQMAIKSPGIWSCWIKDRPLEWPILPNPLALILKQGPDLSPKNIFILTIFQNKSSIDHIFLKQLFI